LPAQVAIYQAYANSLGADHLVYQTTDGDGDVQIYDDTVEVMT